MPTATSSILPDYQGKPDRFDECLGPDGMRPHWKVLFDLLGDDPEGAIRQAAEACRRTIIEQDVSMNVYAGERSAAQPWPLDALPLVLSAADWEQLTSGLRQRAHLYNTLLQDLYGPQRLLRQGAMPAAFLAANPQYLRACAGLGKTRGPFLHTYAADLARSPDGKWWVIEDRLDAPSGLGYSLQNRIIVRQALPTVFAHAPVHRLYRFFRDFRSSLDQVAASAREDRRTVLLTPGPANETYFEHAYLARYLGYPLVEGADLTMRDHQIYLRTVGGLKRVDTIIRRVDSDSCDPLELSQGSLLGVPGLTDAVRHGRVSLANQLGAGALESPALMAFLEPLSQKLFGEELELPSVATWWCGQPKAKEYVLDNLKNLVIKPTFPTQAAHARYGAVIDDGERDAIARDIQDRPWAYCGQERLMLGSAPAFVNDKIQAVPFTVRVFLTWKDGDYRAMPGGLTRFNPSGEDGIVSLQQGSITKDTWVLSDGVIEDRPIVLDGAGAEGRSSTITASRLADNLYWFGRYLERTSHLAKMLGKLDPLLRDEIAVLDPEVASDIAVLLVAVQQGTADSSRRVDDLAEQARSLANDPSLPGTLAGDLKHLLAIVDQIKVLLPPEAWRIVRHLRETLDGGEVLHAPNLREQLTALESVSAESLPHDTGWRFLEMGRRIERASQLSRLWRQLVTGMSLENLSEFRVQTLLHFTDNLFSYRSVYHGVFQPVPVFEWIVGGVENPRSLRFQAEQLIQHLESLPNDLAPEAVGALRTTAFRLVSTIRLADAGAILASAEEGRVFIDAVTDLIADLSERITLIYFAHAELTNQAGLHV